MSSPLVAFSRLLVHAVFRPRQYNNARISEFAKNVRGQKILELGSGKAVRGRYIYSAARFFDDSNEFIQSDVVEEYGHPIVDVTRMDFITEFDVIVCANVLEHVRDYSLAIANIHRALKPGGTALVVLPCMYPLHDEPHDYWRFTEYSLRDLFAEFGRVRIEHKGLRAFPIMYFLEARR